MPNPKIPSMVDWELMDHLERAVWGTRFALHLDSEGATIAANLADQAVMAVREAAPLRNPPLEPESRAARIGIAIELEPFAIWYRVELALAAGLGRPAPVVTDDDVAHAFERYRRGRNDFS